MSAEAPGRRRGRIPTPLPLPSNLPARIAVLAAGLAAMAGAVALIGLWALPLWLVPLAALGDPDRARAAWAAAHGLASLELAGRFPGDADVDAARAAMVRAFDPPG